jgi:hypothetical protein
MGGMDGVNNNKVTKRPPKYLRNAIKIAKNMKNDLAGIDEELFKIKEGLDKAKVVLSSVDPNNTLTALPADSSAQYAAEKVLPNASEVAENTPKSPK